MKTQDNIKNKHFVCKFHIEETNNFLTDKTLSQKLSNNVMHHCKRQDIILFLNFIKVILTAGNKHKQK